MFAAAGGCYPESPWLGYPAAWFSDFQSGYLGQMRKAWERQSATLDLTRAEIEALAASAFPGCRLLQHQILSGGLSNTNIRLTIEGRPAPVLLRIYVRDPAQATKEWALLARLGSDIPVPRLQYTAPANTLLPYPYAVMDWMQGERLEIVLEEKLPAAVLQEMMRDIGAVLARIHALRFAEAGFLDSDLRVATPISVGSEGLLDYLLMQLGVGARGRDRLGAALADQVLDFAKREGELLDTWCEAPSLTHGDFGGSNILLRPQGDGWRVAAVLDWEFAFSASPFFDLGNLLRPPLGARSDASDAVEAGYRTAGGDLPADWRHMTQLIELISWADFLGRPRIGPHLTADARAMMRRIMNDFAHHR